MSDKTKFYHDQALIQRRFDDLAALPKPKPIKCACGVAASVASHGKWKVTYYCEVCAGWEAKRLGK